MTGHITDGVGFIRNLKEHGVEVKGQEMVIIGTVFIEDLDNKEKLAEVVSAVSYTHLTLPTTERV